jgi:hydroxymethylpyrimidine/phosphomethylpyrimidine kinase
LGLNLKDALQKAKEFITHAIEQAPNIGHGRGPINHKAGGAYVA